MESKSNSATIAENGHKQDVVGSLASVNYAVGSLHLPGPGHANELLVQCIYCCPGCIQDYSQRFLQGVNLRVSRPEIAKSGSLNHSSTRLVLCSAC